MNDSESPTYMSRKRKPIPRPTKPVEWTDEAWELAFAARSVPGNEEFGSIRWRGATADGNYWCSFRGRVTKTLVVIVNVEQGDVIWSRHSEWPEKMLNAFKAASETFAAEQMISPRSAAF